MTAGPSGPEWDEPLDRVALCFADLEMTGLDASRDRIVQLCFERVLGGRDVDRLFSLVRTPPGVATRICGISREATAEAPPFDQLAARVEAILDSAIMVAHAAVHDIRFLQAEFARLGRNFVPPRYLDTLALSRRVFELPSHSLAALCTALNIPNPEPHRADNDVRVLRVLWDRIVDELRPASARELWAIGAQTRLPRPEVLAEAERAARLGIPVRIQYRPAGRGPEWLGLCVTAVRRDLDPPLVLGYLLRTRGRRELPADRVLAIEPLNQL